MLFKTKCLCSCYGFLALLLRAFRGGTLPLAGLMRCICVWTSQLLSSEECQRSETEPVVSCRVSFMVTVLVIHMHSLHCLANLCLHLEVPGAKVVVKVCMFAILGGLFYLCYCVCVCFFFLFFRGVLKHLCSGWPCRIVGLKCLKANLSSHPSVRTSWP